jgi:hypothetical protein
VFVMLNEMKGKKGLVGEGISNIILWIIFFIVVAIGIGFLIKELVG